MTKETSWTWETKLKVVTEWLHVLGLGPRSEHHFFHPVMAEIAEMLLDLPHGSARAAMELSVVKKPPVTETGYHLRYSRSRS
jgi:hypothetical protein